MAADSLRGSGGNRRQGARNGVGHHRSPFERRKRDDRKRNAGGPRERVGEGRPDATPGVPPLKCVFPAFTARSSKVQSNGRKRRIMQSQLDCRTVFQRHP